MVSGLSASTTGITLNLQPGWNSIWLDVQPTYQSGENAGETMSVEDVFTNAAITFVARPVVPSGSAEFIADADTLNFNQESWKAWWRHSELNENSLALVEGYQPYLVRVSGTSSVSVTVNGVVEFWTPKFRSDQYTLIGFHLDGAPTFGDFFEAAAGRIPSNRIFRMSSGGDWVGVQSGDTMKSHEAYWVYADGTTNFVGPVSIQFEDFEGLNFGDAVADVEVPDPDGGVGTVFVNLEELVLSNPTGSSEEVNIRLVDASATPASDDLRLYLVEPQPEIKDYTLGNQVVDETVLVEAGITNVVTFGAHRNWGSGERERGNLYQIVVGDQVFWLPVRAANPDLSDASIGSTNAAYTGLWVGSATVDQVSTVSSPSDLQPATSQASLRMIFHVDGEGAVSLIPHVMVMQEKQASPEVAPVQVLVVDETKIPYFEGIEERGGKRVGVRLESIGFDMPRMNSISSQADLLDEIVALSDSDALVELGDVTDADVLNYVNSRSGRPPQLVEDYHQSWAFTGGFGPNQTVQTSSPLVLDPFHRANPFRHAFHPRHAAGYAITRVIEISFDAEQSEGVLRGTFTETVTGLAAFDMVTKGMITLQRVSEVAELQ